MKADHMAAGAFQGSARSALNRVRADPQLLDWLHDASDARRAT